MEVIWSEKAKESLAGIYDYIYPFSPQNAERVIDTLLEIGDSLADKRFEYAKEPIIQKEKYRFIPKWSYKVVYERKETSVIILDIFHTKQNPDKIVF
ncbi:type II toxin-antitoxin system RelE/ParE family toxin [Sinomicrobium sp. M5D2P9]